ncbi:phage terminase large subunit [Kineosporia babensis]|uniref:Phage terminase large subunit n=1 Tax=Kineosporia babensis TaxID=499548 RepID=A0A9X1NBP7_9ACTN|nr:phage terminase large subunit [Kineosporia babensis]MCD5310831.1 phage terminase large subunit [Kineosporia babensis]
MPYNEAAFLAGLERGMRGKNWRQQPFPGPLDLLLALMPDYIETPALRCISDALVAHEVAAESEENPKFLAVSMAPQEGKSTLIAYAYPIWLWLRNPDLRILIISYDNETSWRWGRAIKEALQAHSGDDALYGVDLQLSLRPGSEAVARLQLDGYRGSVSCMSLTGGIAGKPGDRIICDDLVKDRRTARSGAFKRLWKDQWQSNIRPRLGPKAMVVMDHTRWTEDDPIGQQQADNGAAWEYLNIPALVEEPQYAGPAGAPNLGTPNKAKDPLGRKPGEWLKSARGRTPEQWQKTRADVGEADFAALYQGRPMPAQGGLFKRADFRFWQQGADRWTVKIPGRPGPDENLHYAYRFITVDLAASLRTSADFTVAAAWAIAGTGELIMLDLRRKQVEPADHWDEVVAPLQAAWSCPIYVEGSQYGTDLVYTAARAGAIVEPLEADTDKYTRAVPAAKRMKTGILFPPAAHWWTDFENEITLFPGGGAHDDQVDVLAYAHRIRGAYWVPPDNSRGGHGQHWTPPEPSPMDHLAGGTDLYSAPL